MKKYNFNLNKENATFNDLANAVKFTLEKEGVLNKVRAQMREKVYQCLHQDDQIPQDIEKENITVPTEQKNVNKLILEYLDFNGYDCTKSVFVTETGMNLSEYEDINKNENSIPKIYTLSNSLNVLNEPPTEQ